MEEDRSLFRELSSSNWARIMKPRRDAGGCVSLFLARIPLDSFFPFLSFSIVSNLIGRCAD